MCATMVHMSSITLLSTSEVANELGKDVRTVHRMIEAGTLIPVLKLPGRTGAYVFEPSDVAALKDSEK